MNYFINLRIILKNSDEISNFQKEYNKLYPILWMISLYLIPIINSSVFQFIFPGNVSFFRQNSIWFLILGIIFVALGLKINSNANKLLKHEEHDKDMTRLITNGIYKIMRHPLYSAWIIIFIGLTFIFDSFVSLIICPFLIVLVEIESYFEEEKILIKKFGTKYEDYKLKVPSRLFPQPYNYILIILTIILIYIGFINYL